MPPGSLSESTHESWVGAWHRVRVITRQLDDALIRHSQAAAAVAGQRVQLTSFEREREARRLDVVRLQRELEEVTLRVSELRSTARSRLV